MSHPIIGVDHTLIGVCDLEGASEAYRRLGFTITPRGRHIGWGTANYCIMFANDYIELLGIADPTQFVNRLDEFLERQGEGLLGLAFATQDAGAVHGALPDCTQAPKDLGRLLELPEGDVLPRFKLVHFEPGTTPALSAFVCQHLTPELVRKPEWLDHANGAVGLVGITVVVEDPGALVAAYAALFGETAVNPASDCLEVSVGSYTMRFLTSVQWQRRYPGQPPRASMVVRCRDLSNLCAQLERAAIRPMVSSGRWLMVPASAACGVVLEFIASE